MGGCPDRARRSAVCGLITMGFLCAFRGSAGLESGVPRALYFPMSTVHCPPSTFHHPLSTLTLLTILTGLTGCLQSFPRRPMSVGWRMRWPWSGRRVFYGLAMRNLRASFKCDRLSVDTLRPYTYSAHTYSVFLSGAAQGALYEEFFQVAPAIEYSDDANRFFVDTKEYAVGCDN